MSSDIKQSVGFIGLGMMGGPMAENILKSGFPLTVYDIDSKKVDRFVGLGADAAKNPADVASRAQVIISMVDTTAQTEDIVSGPGGLLESASPGQVVICMSTIDPVMLRKLQQLFEQKEVGFLDAPVSGMEKGAKEGTLRAFVGGDEAALEQARTVLDAMTSEIIHFGPAGQGTVMKLVNNMLVQVGWVVVAEALALGVKAGLDPDQMVEVIGKSTGNSVAFQYSAPRILARDFDGIRLDISYKDLDLQTSLGKTLDVPMLMANVAQQVYRMGRVSGLGSEDGGAAIGKVYEELAGVSLASKR